MEIIQSSGPSLVSLLRGVTGMLVLIFIAFLMSNNRRAISWKTVGIGLFIQILIAVGVLKINFFKSIFKHHEITLIGEIHIKNSFLFEGCEQSYSASITIMWQNHFAIKLEGVCN